MSPLFMETVYEPNSPSSVSAEDCTAGSEREGDGQPVGHTGKKRREKNRDAARKSRKKQTERADVLHEELQRLERSNSSLHKEIAALKKDLLLYTTALERHKPHCCLTASASGSSSPSGPSRSPSIGRRSGSSPPTANSTSLAGPPFSTSLNASAGLHTLDRVGSAHLSPTTASPPATTPSGSFVTSSSNLATVPCALSLAMVPAPHSLFASEPAVASNVVHVSAVPGPRSHPQSASLSAQSCYPDTLDAFLTKQTSFPPAPSNAGPAYSLTQHEGPARGRDTITHPYSHSSNQSSPLSPFLPLTVQDCSVQSFSVSPQANFPARPLKPSYCHQMPPNAASSLSLLTVPNPPDVPQITSNGFAQTTPSLPLLLDPARDLSLSELLEVNDWILSGTADD